MIVVSKSRVDVEEQANKLRLLIYTAAPYLRDLKPCVIGRRKRFLSEVSVCL